MVPGRSLESAFKIDGQVVKDTSGGLPTEHERCAQLAADTLRKALQDYFAGKRTPWKNMYNRNM